MLASANATVGGIFTAPLKARNQSRAGMSGGRIKNGIGIGPLRATGASPGALGGRSTSASSGGILSQFNTQAHAQGAFLVGHFTHDAHTQASHQRSKKADHRPQPITAENR